MKKSELIFNLLSIPTDAIMLLLAGVSSFYLRQHTIDLVGPIIFQLRLGEFLPVAYKVIPGLILIFAWLGLYNLKGTRNFFEEFKKILIGVSLGLFLVILLFFFNQSLFPSRFIVLATWGLGIVFVLLGRVILKTVQKIFFVRGVGLHKIVIIKGGKIESSAIQQFYKNQKYGYEMLGEFDYNERLFEILETVYEQKDIDEIMQADPSLPEAANLKLLEFSRNKGISFSFVPNLFEVQRNSVETNNIKGQPVISLKNTPLDGWGKVAKRILDIFASAICLILTAPFFLIISLLIKIDSPGRVIYVALRGGRGKNFNFFKFRTMFSHMSVGDNYGGAGAEKIRKDLWRMNSRGGESGPFLKIKHDPRVTRVGRFLRKTKLDEIPQFWNVFKGDMSMVGPRAHVLDEVERYKNRYSRMFSIKPGIFGMSQIAQVSWPDLPFEEEIRLNTYYIENWSLWLDLKILAKSFWLLCFGSKPKEDY